MARVAVQTTAKISMTPLFLAITVNFAAYTGPVAGVTGLLGGRRYRPHPFSPAIVPILRLSWSELRERLILTANLSVLAHNHAGCGFRSLGLILQIAEPSIGSNSHFCVGYSRSLHRPTV
jgi:hypothetical protein